MALQHLTRDETRDRILKVALQLIADQGFAATSTREISERLGFTKAALYYHFRTKEDLLAAIVAPAIEDLRMLLGKAGPRNGPAARRQVVEGYVDLVASHTELIRVSSTTLQSATAGCLPPQSLSTTGSPNCSRAQR